jgi:hypothetical protein
MWVCLYTIDPHVLTLYREARGKFKRRRQE